MLINQNYEAFSCITIIVSTNKDEKEKEEADLTGTDPDQIKEELDKHFDKNDDGDQ